MAATFNKVNVFTEDMAKGVHNFAAAGDTIKADLTNSAVTSTFAVRADYTLLSSANGWTTGVDVQNDESRSGGTVTVFGVSIAITASGGSIGPFRYVVLQNDTTTKASKPLIGYWDYGSALTLLDTESLAIKFNDATTGTTGTLFTVV